jgi:hypothetical protein
MIVCRWYLFRLYTINSGTLFLHSTSYGDTFYLINTNYVDTFLRSTVVNDTFNKDLGLC